MIKNAEDIRDGSSVPGLRRSPGGGHDNPLQYSCLENPMDRGALWATVQGHKESDKTEAISRTHTDSILKSRDITLLTKVSIVKAMVFPVVMCECESWTISKAECQRIDGFAL